MNQLQPQLSKVILKKYDFRKQGNADMFYNRTVSKVWEQHVALTGDATDRDDVLVRILQFSSRFMITTQKRDLCRTDSNCDIIEPYVQ